MDIRRKFKDMDQLHAEGDIDTYFDIQQEIIEAWEIMLDAFEELLLESKSRSEQLDNLTSEIQARMDRIRWKYPEHDEWPEVSDGAEYVEVITERFASKELTIIPYLNVEPLQMLWRKQVKRWRYVQ